MHSSAPSRAAKRRSPRPSEQSVYDAVKTAWAAYLVEDEKTLALSDGGEASLTDARRQATGAASVTFNALMKALKADVAYNADGAQQAMKTAAATYRGALILDAASVAAALITGALLALFITRSIVVPIDQAAKFADTVARGDSSSRVDASGRDEPARLLTSLAKMNDSLVGIVGQVRAASDSIATGSSQIATGNADLSQRTEEQASNLQQKAASMEQLTSTVQTNADTVRQAAELAGSASSAAMCGGDAVAQVVGTMDAITTSSKKIADIIGVIDSIASRPTSSR